MSVFDSSTKWLQRHVLTVPTFGHAVMVACAIASFDNVRSFFAAIHATGLIATGLGIAIGAALVMTAGLLSGMGNNWRNSRFQLVAAVTLLFALLSGGVQAAAYAMHGLSLLPAVALGLSLPVVGELGVSLAVAAYEQEQKAKRLAAADDQVEEKINAAVDLALSDIDMTNAKRDIEMAARKIVKNKLDSLLARRVGTVQPTQDEAFAQLAVDSHNAQDEDPGGNKRQITTKNHVVGRKSVDELNEARRQLVEDRRRTIIELCELLGPMSAPEIVDRLAADRNIVASVQTVRDDCNALVEQGDLLKDGRKWFVVMAIPDPIIVRMNGASH